MRRLTLGLGVMAALLLVAGVSAQNKHDFSGSWTADVDKNGGAAAAPAGGRGGGRGGATDFTVTMDDKTMNIVTMRNGTESKNSYKLDGSVSKNDPPMGRAGATGSTTPTETTAKWDGDKLVLTTKLANGTSTTTYWLDSGDLVRESVQPGRDGSPGQPARTYFKKKM